MANVPPELFRRKTTFRTLQQIEAHAQEFRAAGVYDNANAVMAGYNDLAAHFATLTGRLDLARNFERQRDELIAEAQTVAPLRSPKGVRRPKK